MRWRQAQPRLRERAAAAVGLEPGFGSERVDTAPEDIARRLLVGLVDLGDLPDVLDALMMGAGKTVASAAESGSPMGAMATVYTSLAQTLALGILLGQPEPGARDGG